MAVLPAFPSGQLNDIDATAAYLAGVAAVVAERHNWSGQLSAGVQSALTEFADYPDSSAAYLIAVSARLDAIQAASAGAGGTSISAAESDDLDRLDAVAAQMLAAVASEQSADQSVVSVAIDGAVATAEELAGVASGAARAASPIIALLKNPTALRAAGALLMGVWLWRRL